MIEHKEFNLDDLNSPQREAVQYTSGPLLVLAGAGTGKTRVLTYRIAYILSQKLAYPHEILAVTFTNKAAAEMTQRINRLIPSSGLTIGTFHGVAAKILRNHSEYFNLSPYFTIIDMDDQIKLVKNILQDNNIDIKINIPKNIHSIISRWKDMSLTPSKISQSDVSTPFDKIAKIIYPQYQEKLIDSNAVDFGDILLYTTELFLTQSDIAKIYQNKFKYILIDEYQDVNSVQYIWSRLLANRHKNICCVGDDDQSIYSWRGAEVANILKFEQDFPNAKIIKLEQNYRSTTPILKAASSLIHNNNLRHSKTLWTDKEEGQKIKIVKCSNEREEAKLICEEIKKLIKIDVDKQDIAVLVRTTFQMRAIEEGLIACSIPYKIIGGPRFYERSEIKDILCYIRLILNNDDNLAFERIINVPKRGIGNVTIKKIKNVSDEDSISYFKAICQMKQNNLISASISDSVSSLIEIVIKYKEIFETTKDLYKSVKNFLDDIGYIKILKEQKTEEAYSKVENINEMLKAMSEYETLQGFVEHISLVSNSEGVEFVGMQISLMTLHAAKGLEFDSVFLPGFEEGIFPHQRTINEGGAKGIEEERRIAYVGITRAKNKLYILYAESRRSFGDYNYSIPSRFLSEIPEDISEKYNSYSFLNYNFKKQILQNIMSNIVNDSPKIGTKIMHKIFGQGILLRVNSDIYEIAFSDNGIKKIKKDFVEII
jgi:DNA helicase-2/ATP-dependent DNA helicase PcrA